MIFALCACSSGQGMPMAKFAQKDAAPQSFYSCYGYSCTQRALVELSSAQWAGVLKGFKNINSAEQERIAITKAIAKIEALVVQQTGLTPDLAEAKTVKQNAHQMDCIDETVNTDLYLGFLQDAGAFKFHERAHPLHRGFFIDGMWPHNTAAVREIDSGAVYAIDSYYRDNGVKADAVPKNVWLDKWRPSSTPN